MSFFSQRVSRIQPSPTISITAKAKKLKQEGKKIIDFSSGEPDFDTPDNIKSAAVKAIQDGETKYTPVNGTKELIEAIIKKFKKENDLVFEPDEITVGCGGKQVIFNALLATIEKGDEIIIPAPYWVSYPDMALLVEGHPIVLDSSLNLGYSPARARKEAAKIYGAQCVVVSIQAKRKDNQSWEAYNQNGRERTRMEVTTWAKEVVSRGAGEILLTSIDQDGTRKGLDYELIEARFTDVEQLTVLALFTWLWFFTLISPKG